MISKNFRCMLLIMLTVVLASAMLNGCARTAEKEKEKGAEGSKAAKGRYVEEEIELPFGKGERGLNIAKTKEGNLVLFSSVEDTEVNRYEYTSGSWKKTPLDWILKACKKNIYPLEVYETKDGVQFVTATEEDRKTHIFKSTDAKNWEELKIPYLEKKTEYGYPHIAGFLVDDGGNYWLQDIYNAKIIIVSADTQETIKEIGTRETGSDSQKLMFAGEDKTVAVNTEDGKYTVYSKNLEELGTFSYDGDESGQMCHDGKNWYMVTAEGIARMRTGDDSREVLMDGSMGAMGSPVNSAEGMVCRDDGEVYVLYVQWKTMTYSLARYVYDKDVAAVPEHTLQVFGLLESDTIRQAVVGFQRKNPDVKVEFNNSGKGAGEISSDDIRTLNTELLSGKGADVLLLNGLPADAYIEKGVLSDLTGIAKKMMEDNAYLENIMKNTVQKDKKVYGIPVKFTVPVMYGDEQIKKALDSLDSLKAYVEKNPDAGIFGVTNKEYIRDFLFQMYHEELIKKDGSVDKVKMEELLELSQDIEKNSKTDFFEGEDMRSEQDTLFANPGDLYIVKHPDMVATDRVSGLSDMVIPYEIAREKKFKIEALKDYYIPEAIAGINSNTKEKDIAEEFLRYLFSEELQKAKLDDGFPVMLSALEEKKQEVNDQYASVFSLAVGGNIDGEDFSISAQYPTEEEVEGFIGLCKALKNPADQDRAVWDIYRNEADKVLEGSIKAKEGAENIRKKVELYLAE